MMKYAIISGTVRDLSLAKGYEDLAFAGRGKNIIGIGAITAAATGNALSSTILMSASGGAEVDMEYFSCFVGDTSVVGRFHKVGFANGDIIDFVVTMENGSAHAHCARDPIKRLIWTLPYKTRGHIAQKKNDILSSFTISILSSVLITLAIFSQLAGSISDCWETLLKSASMGFFFVLIVNFLTRLPFYKYSRDATEIFSALGFTNPEQVNLPRSQDRAEKSFSQESGQPLPRSWETVPWRFRYERPACSAPDGLHLLENAEN